MPHWERPASWFPLRFYYPLSQAEVEAYYRELARESALPIVMYNIPTHTKTSIDPGVVRDLMDVERIAGIKDSSGDENYMTEILSICADKSDFEYYIGSDCAAVESAGIGRRRRGCRRRQSVPDLYGMHTLLSWPVTMTASRPGGAR